MNLKHKHYLYTIIFPNNKKYVGITTNISRRIIEYRYKSHNPSRPVEFAINKYDFNNLIWEYKVIGKITKKEANKIERKIIKKFNLTDKKFGYNRVDGGEGRPVGKNSKAFSKETKEKMSIAAKKHVGQKNNFYGKNHTCETKRILSEIMINMGKFSGENNPKSKLTKDNVRDIRKKYACGISATELSKKYCVHSDTILRIVKRLSWKMVGD